MLEGKEFEKTLGDYGSAFVDVNDQLDIEVGLSAKVNVLVEIRKLAKGNEMAIKVIDILEGLLKKPAA